MQLVAVAVDKDKGSQNALKWALDHLLKKGQTVTLIHVRTIKTAGTTTQNQDELAGGYKTPTDQQSKDIFLPFRCYCTRKDIHCKDVLLEDTDVAKAIVEFAAHAALEKLVIGTPSKSGFVRRFKSSDKASSICKGAPDFCSVYVISKGKVSSVKNAIRAAPAISPLRTQILGQTSSIHNPDPTEQLNMFPPRDAALPGVGDVRSLRDESIRSPFTRASYKPSMRSMVDSSFTSESDISFVSSGRPSIDRGFTPRMSTGSDRSSVDFMRTPHRWMDSYSSVSELSQDTPGTSWSSLAVDEAEAEMKRLKLELKQTMDMYSTACKEALTAKQKAMELNRWKMEEEQRLEAARTAEESALALVERERARCKAALEAAEASQRIAELEAQKRMNAEMKALKEAQERNMSSSDPLAYADVRYRKYSIEEIEIATEFFADKRKIGEGGYGPVFRCNLDHTQVAIKVLRPDAAQGKTQFQQEVEILSCIRHPNMVLLLGACPEYGCLVYEYMANGSLEDRLFRRGNTPVISWQDRFRIACEIGSGLLFLHQTKPEPLVHRDLKPANILLDRNYVSKISDVGLARLVPPSVANSVTQYLMTSAAGTFCYIDPEYQQTGMLGVKSDIYSLGIILLQLLTARPPMGLMHHVEHAIEKGTFVDMLDQAVPDWPLEEAKSLAQLALHCSQLRRKDRPDLSTVVLPELERLRDFADEHLPLYCTMGSSTHSTPMHSNTSQQMMEMSDPLIGQDGYESSISRSSTSSVTGRRSNVC
ncbi:hypothetical protein J5N97_003557 [Dioscorea zingiberensis]|uniref:RING-type E3 ubiquitin transferase n=1 Tax=Dioscorea zingiberensis TaxID=325984 RepID=A0A9D5HQM5_9LILI|nr:hypothetical protein J5N97_003557 [Dioscorea zingiberensis]